MEGKLTKLEKYWILYDVGNSAFVLLVSTILPIYFNYLAGNGGVSEVDALAYWGYAASISTLLVALIGPVLGTVADTEGYKKPIFTACMTLGVLGCAALALPVSWLAFLVIFVVAKVGYSSSLIFYDAMLSDVTSPERMDQVSSQGYAWGYIGSCIPFIISLVFVLGNEVIGLSMPAAMAIAFLVNAGWWFLVTVPLLKTYQQKHGVPRKEHVIRESFGRLKRVMGDIRGHRKIFLFLLAFFFYIDGVYTIIEMATAYGSAIGLDSQGLLLALLVTDCSISLCAFFWKSSKKISKYNSHQILYCMLFLYCFVCYSA